MLMRKLGKWATFLRKALIKSQLSQNLGKWLWQKTFIHLSQESWKSWIQKAWNWPPSFLGKLGRIHKNYPRKLVILRKLGKIHYIFLGKPGKIHPISWECQNLSETADKLNGHIHVKRLVPRSWLALAYITHLMFSTKRQTFEKLTEVSSLHCPKRS